LVETYLAIKHKDNVYFFTHSFGYRFVHRSLPVIHSLNAYAYLARWNCHKLT